MRISAVCMLLASTTVVTIAAPALASYYIVRQGAAGPCHVVAGRPANSKTIVGGEHRYYVKRALAEKQLPLLCKSE